MITKPTIEVKVLCLFVRSGRVLAGKFVDATTGEVFYRALGGSLNFAETSEQGIRREMREELHSEIQNLVLLQTVENIFTYKGAPWHQIVFLYKGDLEDQTLYQKDKIRIVEETYELEAEWIPVKDILEGKTILNPKLDYKKYLS